MHEHYGKEAQKHIDSVVANAAARETELLSSIQARVDDIVLLQQLEQVRNELVSARQDADSWKDILLIGRTKQSNWRLKSRSSPGN